MPERVLIVDDDASTRATLASIARNEGWEVVEAGSGQEALDRFREASINLVLCDLVLPGADGVEILRSLRAEGRLVPFVLITGHASMESAVEALRLGALDYLSKPVRIGILRSLLDKARRMGGAVAPASVEGPRLDGVSQAIREVGRLIDLAGPSRSTVLITGETGTGKEIVADLIHRKSSRSGKPLIKVNCAALPENLIESELFGHERGAFTGAERSRAGRFELADGGTLFLDEISEMSWANQARLLRVLQVGEFERVGSSQTRKVDVRVISATNRNLRRLVDENKLREDLYYRLHVIEIHIPPLRERREDLDDLVAGVLGRLAGEARRARPTISDRVWRILRTYSWPGNVRELEHVLEHAFVLSGGGEISLDHLPAEVRPERPRSIEIPIGTPLERAEQEIIRETLKAVDQDKRAAARMLGLSRSAFYRRLDDLKREAGKQEGNREEGPGPERKGD